MQACSTYPCLRTSSGCPVCDPTPAMRAPFGGSLPYVQPPRTMPVNVPFSTFGVTVVTMDRDGNVTIKVDQVPPAHDPQ